MSQVHPVSLISIYDAALLPQRLSINIFINSDAILNRDALWSIQGKKHYLQAAMVYTIQEKYYDERFLSYNGDMSINFLSILDSIFQLFTIIKIRVLYNIFYS